MHLYKLIILIGIVALLGTGIVCCTKAPKPFDYQPENELKPGPGLFSGEDGRFMFYQSQETGETSKADELKPPAD